MPAINFVSIPKYSSIEVFENEFEYNVEDEIVTEIEIDLGLFLEDQNNVVFVGASEFDSVDVNSIKIEIDFGFFFIFNIILIFVAFKSVKSMTEKRKLESRFWTWNLVVWIPICMKLKKLQKKISSSFIINVLKEFQIHNQRAKSWKSTLNF